LLPVKKAVMVGLFLDADLGFTGGFISSEEIILKQLYSFIHIFLDFVEVLKEIVKAGPKCLEGFIEFSPESLHDFYNTLE
jgi:hypothetical protein